jgi:hypothetical protein
MASLSNFPEISPCPGGGHNFQGGAMYAGNDVKVEINTSSFISNGRGVSNSRFVPRNFLEFLLQFPVGHMVYLRMTTARFKFCFDFGENWFNSTG